jgi:hypothetical protein
MKNRFLTITRSVSRPESVKIVPQQKNRPFAVKRIIWAEKRASKSLPYEVKIDPRELVFYHAPSL